MVCCNAQELEGFGIRLNKKPPGITFRKKEKGGINFSSAIQNPQLDVEGALLSCIGKKSSHGTDILTDLNCPNLAWWPYCAACLHVHYIMCILTCRATSCVLADSYCVRGLQR